MQVHAQICYALRMQVAKLVKAQAKVTAEERRALLAEEHANMERLLATISASINRDLPQRLDDLMRAQLAEMPPPLAASALQPAVQAALAAALPGELAGSPLQVCLAAPLSVLQPRSSQSMTHLSACRP